MLYSKEKDKLKKRKKHIYLANPAGMLQSQASTGHGCSYIPFKVDHNGSHRVEAPWFLRHSENRTVFHTIFDYSEEH